MDEGFLLQSIREQGVSIEKEKPTPLQQVEKAPELTEAAPEKPKERKEPPERKQNESYSTRYLQKNEFKGRQCVYISQRIHTTVLEIVKILSDKNVTVGGYIDTILTAHFEMHRNEITELYNTELQKKSEKSLLE